MSGWHLFSCRLGSSSMASTARWHGGEIRAVSWARNWILWQIWYGCQNTVTPPSWSHVTDCLPQISFGVAPAMVAFTIGCRSVLDTFGLAFFVLCGLTRLARFNVTVAVLPKDATGKSKYFEGTPIPTSLFLDAVMAYWVYNRWILDNMPMGTWFQGSAVEFHPVVLMFVLHGCLMTSKTIRIPKP